MLRFTNSWRQNKQVDWPLDPSNLLKVYLHYLVEYRASLFIYLARLVAMLSWGIEVPPFLQLIQELLSYSSAASWTMVVSPNWHGPRGASELRMRICKLIQTVVHSHVLSLQSLRILEGKNKQENYSWEALYFSHGVMKCCVVASYCLQLFFFFVIGGVFFPCLSSRCFTFCSYWTWIRFSFQLNHGYPVSQMWYSTSCDPLWYFGSGTSF